MVTPLYQRRMTGITSLFLKGAWVARTFSKEFVENNNGAGKTDPAGVGNPAGVSKRSTFNPTSPLAAISLLTYVKEWVNFPINRLIGSADKSP
jgi:hypothetical protein